MPAHPVRPLVVAAAIAVGAAGGVCIAVSAVAAGADGVRGALLGLALAVVYLGMTLIVGALTLTRDPNIMMAAAMGSFLLKLIGLAVVLRWLQGAGAFAHASTIAFAVTASALAVVTVVAEAVAHLRARRPVWDAAENRR